ncbi:MULTISPECIES: phosphotransferase [unclassified Bacillus (in: firmicutes)]|uniref:phosphotransferase family protein n=1 Tax=unclassified Bacillus (in: firmicutes) TaxID=185979 RepID=UPI001BE57CE9|nr:MULTISPECIES: phosphotransferase [unclassified Bacillus (in: firmicutes)]MBT2636883.1 aminoglycoside phosphotransferase family protein [Bacillus sp. ISL-39]MBT2659971.1 aminoglycoside phosphotransferase family protein [Bacillus sp. ISL-45]
MEMRNSQAFFKDVLGEIKKIVKLPDQGCTSEVSRIFTGDGTYLLKSAFKEKYREWLKSEAEVLESLSLQRSIPVPRLYGFMEDEHASHLLMSFEKGISLTAALKNAGSSCEQQRLIRSFGQFMMQLHEQEPVFMTDSDWLETQLNRARKYAESGQADGSLELLEQLIANKPNYVKQTMVHGDCTSDNVLVIEGEVRVFIDVAGMTLGDPRYDEALATRKIRNNPELLAAFYEGYTRYRVTDEEFQYFEEGLYEFF